MLDLQQEKMGRIIGIRRLRVTWMEENGKKPVTPSSDPAIRMFYALQQNERHLGHRILELLNDFDDQQRKQATFVPCDREWMREKTATSGRELTDAFRLRGE
jgi:hypothetical protein